MKYLLYLNIYECDIMRRNNSSNNQSLFQQLFLRDKSLKFLDKFVKAFFVINFFFVPRKLKFCKNFYSFKNKLTFINLFFQVIKLNNQEIKYKNIELFFQSKIHKRVTPMLTSTQIQMNIHEIVLYKKYQKMMQELQNFLLYQ